MSTSLWIPTDAYPADGRLRVLLVTSRDGRRSIPVIGSRVNGVWFLSLLGENTALSRDWCVSGWQELQYEAHSGVSDDELRDAFATLVRTNKTTNTPFIGDLVGWFRHATGPMVAELCKLRATARKD